MCACSRQTFHFHSWIILISLKHFSDSFSWERWQINEISAIEKLLRVFRARAISLTRRYFLQVSSLVIEFKVKSRFFLFYFFHTGSQTFFKPVLFFSLNDGHCYSTKSRRMAIFTTIKWRIFIFTFLWETLKLNLILKRGVIMSEM